MYTPTPQIDFDRTLTRADIAANLAAAQVDVSLPNGTNGNVAAASAKRQSRAAAVELADVALEPANPDALESGIASDVVEGTDVRR